MKNYYATRKEQGLCTRCGLNPPVDGKTMCAECRELDHERQKLYRERKRAEMEALMGIPRDRPKDDDWRDRPTIIAVNVASGHISTDRLDEIGRYNI